jgi:hypothetical protein
MWKNLCNVFVFLLLFEQIRIDLLKELFSHVMLEIAPDLLAPEQVYGGVDAARAASSDRIVLRKDSLDLLRKVRFPPSREPQL